MMNITLHGKVKLHKHGQKRQEIIVVFPYCVATEN